MNVKDMTDLIHAAEGVKGLEEALQIICHIPLAVGYEEGALGKLSRIYDIIHRNSRFYHPEADDIYDVRDEQGRNIYDILEMDAPAEEKASMLLPE